MQESPTRSLNLSRLNVSEPSGTVVTTGRADDRDTGPWPWLECLTVPKSFCVRSQPGVVSRLWHGGFSLKMLHRGVWLRSSARDGADVIGITVLRHQ